VRRVAAGGRLQVPVLRVGERTLATRCNLVADPGLFYLKVAYDETLAEFSPGIRLEVESFDLFHDRPESHWVDACSDPNNETMNRLLPRAPQAGHAGARQGRRPRSGDTRRDPRRALAA
jgi:Acetyltransferase (GNAT) domain